MKKFIFKIFNFSFFILLIILIGFLLPPTPRYNQSIFFSQKIKDSLLKNTSKPRLILVGGSNISMGINSQILKDSLKLNPINTSIHAALGLKYMMDHNFKYLKDGDQVILIPEYQQYFDNFSYGMDREEMFQIILNYNISEIRKLNLKQFLNLLKFIPSFALSKFKFQEYYYDKNELFMYASDGYNEYGDFVKHWHLKNTKDSIDKKIGLKINLDLIKEIKNYKMYLSKKNIKLYISFPGYQSSSFNFNKEKIYKIYNLLVENNFDILGTPEKYKIPDSLMCTSVYHLSKNASNIRTKLLINDFKKATLSKN
jgi:hypothetical protein